ncbi:DgyrCDS13036 [Dimorphilus gyrociliatus]|uniref:DgyrCDS13036 n=1 Tax=Dimorphilus gyrociliatus TaxID=2664684 RepID=A0A7I8W9G2_9ANNE|nr:DgyrCDS13036 [Dimorphilus gyrociliatus]
MMMINEDVDEHKQLNNILSQKLDELDNKPKEDDEEFVVEEQLSQENNSGLAKKSLWKFQFLYEWLVSQFYEFFADFCEDQGVDDSLANSNENKQLSVKKLKETIKRFRTDAKPIYDYIRYFHYLITWKNPAVSFITLCDKEETKDLGVTDKVQLVLNIATKVQVGVSNISDNLEKLKKVRRKYDSTYNMWMNLPTDNQIENKLKAAAINRNVLSVNEEVTEANLDTSHVAFCQVFSLPSTEKPLPGWIHGRRCTKISRDKPLTSAFKNGKLYLTNSFICFERNKAHSSKNLLIPIINVQNVAKAKYNSWFPGNGMAIEIQTETEDQPLLFGAIINRDECYESILNHALIRQLPWAIELQNSQPMNNSAQNSPCLRKRRQENHEIEEEKHLVK